jgi:hypothetical protein
MRKSVFITVRRTRTSAEADRVIGLLRNARFLWICLFQHPWRFLATNASFPVQVPNEAANAAEQILKCAINEGDTLKTYSILSLSKFLDQWFQNSLIS